jgi:lipopolysaccharide export system permease protein
MKIIDRYLGTTIIQATLIVLLMLMGLSIFIALVREFGDIGTGDYHLLSAIGYVLLSAPAQLYVFFPAAGLLGVLLGLGMLANHNELTILRASSMSLGRITGSVMRTAAAMLFLATLIGEGLAPAAQHFAESHKALLLSSGQTLKTSHGIWMRDGQNFLYVHAILNNRHIAGITRYEFDAQHHLVSASFAQTGFYTHHRWLMKNIVVSQINPAQIRTQQIAQDYWPLAINPDVLHTTEVDPSEMSLKQLYNYMHYLKNNNLNAGSYALAFWQRVTQPLATLVMMWLAIPFVFGPLRSAAMGLRILAGTVLGFTFITLNDLFGPLSAVYQLPPALTALMPTVLFAVVAYLLQRRVG